MNKNLSEDLQTKAEAIHRFLNTEFKRNHDLVPRPFNIEITGPPSCGKSEIIEKLDTSLRRMKFKVKPVQEGAKYVRDVDRSTPLYNLSTGVYALNELRSLISSRSIDIGIFERCAFDAYCWIEYWRKNGKLKNQEANSYQEFFLSRFWTDNIDVVYFVICDPEVAVQRESKIHAFNQEKGGTTNVPTIQALVDIFKNAHRHLYEKFPQLQIIDTTNLTEQEMVDLVLETTMERLVNKINSS